MTSDDSTAGESEQTGLQAVYKSLLKTVQTQAEDFAALDMYLSDARGRDIDDLSNDAVFFRLSLAVFSAGFNRETIMKYRKGLRRVFGEYELVANYNEDDIRQLLSDDSLIRNEGKIRAMVANAATFEHIIRENGSFAAYLNEFETATEALDEMQKKFDYVGPEVAREFLKEIGYAPGIKRDVHVRRISNRIGLVPNENAIDEIDTALNRMAATTGESLTVIDRVFWLHGAGYASFGLDSICHSGTPECERCLVASCESRQKPYRGG